MLYINKLSLNIPDSVKPRVVVIGGGFAGVNLVKNLSEKKLPGGAARQAKLQWFLATALPGGHCRFGTRLHCRAVKENVCTRL